MPNGPSIPGFATVAPLRPVRRAARRLRDRLRSSSLVLLYHRVAASTADPWSLCVHPDRFAEHMDVLARSGRVVPLADLVAAVTAGRRRTRSIVVTFDDGYADFASAALPVLERAGLPVTLFATTGQLDDAAEFWWDVLDRYLLGAAALPPRLDVRVAGRRHVWETALVERDALHRAVHRVLGRANAAARAEALARLRGSIRGTPARTPAQRSLTAEELRRVAASSVVALGAHSVSHPFLSALDAAEQRREIVESRDRLEALTGAPVVDFSYPHGDASRETVDLVRAAGFRSACGTACATAWAASDPWALPRVEVPDLDGAGFARWLGDWMGGGRWKQ